MASLEELVKFVEMYNLPRLNHEEIENINSPIKSNEIITVIKNLSANKSPGPDGFADEVYQTFREKLTIIFLKVFQGAKAQDQMASQVNSTKNLGKS